MMRAVSTARQGAAADQMKVLLDSIDRLQRLTDEIHSAIKRPHYRLIAMSEVESRVAMKKSAIYARIKKKTFPAPVKEGEFTARFVDAEVDAWIEARMRERDEGENTDARG